jgi:hypothetical protein
VVLRVGALAKNTATIPKKIFALDFALGNIFLVASMVLAILHNVIIGQTVRLGACTSRGKGCTIMPHYVT